MNIAALLFFLTAIQSTNSRLKFIHKLLLCKFTKTYNKPQVIHVALNLENWHNRPNNLHPLFYYWKIKQGSICDPEKISGRPDESACRLIWRLNKTLLTFSINWYTLLITIAPRSVSEFTKTRVTLCL